MDSKLLKQLKESGFPVLEAKPISNFTLTEQKIETGTWFHIPTLEELIEAFGGKGILLDGNNTEKNHWLAQSQGYQGVGSTPTEAVVKLYIELNKNKHD